MQVFRDGGYWFCPYCSSFHFPTEVRDGVRVVGEQSGTACPICGEELVSAQVSDAPVLHCERCRGLLIEQEGFRLLIEVLRAQATGPADRPKPLNWQECERSLRCPSCGRTMDTHPYYGPGNVVIDLCIPCRHLWLDVGELGRIVNAPGRDRGRC